MSQIQNKKIDTYICKIAKVKHYSSRIRINTRRLGQYLLESLIGNVGDAIVLVEFKSITTD